MKREDCTVGMEIMFGRPNGAWTKAKVTKCNPSKAEVSLIEVRGTGRGSEVGSVVSVPYSMMISTCKATLPTPTNGKLNKIPAAVNGLHYCTDCGQQTLRTIETTEPDGSGEYKQVCTCDECEQIVYIIRHKV